MPDLPDPPVVSRHAAHEDAGLSPETLGEIREQRARLSLESQAVQIDSQRFNLETRRFALKRMSDQANLAFFENSCAVLKRFRDDVTLSASDQALLEEFFHSLFPRVPVAVQMQPREMQPREMQPRVLKFSICDILLELGKPLTRYAICTLQNWLRVFYEQHFNRMPEVSTVPHHDTTIDVFVFPLEDKAWVLESSRKFFNDK